MKYLEIRCGSVRFKSFINFINSIIITILLLHTVARTPNVYKQYQILIYNINSLFDFLNNAALCYLFCAPIVIKIFDMVWTMKKVDTLVRLFD